jgi:DNA-binding beta-propeller fold protein YncE
MRLFGRGSLELFFYSESVILASMPPFHVCHSFFLRVFVIGGVCVLLGSFWFQKGFAVGSICGDGILQIGEECDAGAENGESGSTCTASCTHLLLQCINQGSCGCFDTFQPAEFTIGQTIPGGFSENIHGYLPNNGGFPVSDEGFDRPTDIALDTHFRLLFVADRMNNRVLVFQLDASYRPLHASADFVLGQPDFSSKQEGSGENGMMQPSGIAIDSKRNRLFVSDSGNNRVLVYTNVTPQNLVKGLTPTFVLGQEDFSETDPETASARMKNPHGLAVSMFGDLYVADTGNNRVLRFDLERALTSGQFAETVLGQKTFTDSFRGTTLSSLSAPRDITIDLASKTIIVADTGNNRVLFFHEADIKTITPGGEPNEAYHVLNLNKGADDKSLYGPQSVAVSRDMLFVADTFNSRVLLFPLTDALNATKRIGASTLLGQDRFGDNTNLLPPDARDLLYPSAVNISEGDCTIFVADTGEHRVTVYTSKGSACVPPSPPSTEPFNTCNGNGICEVNAATINESCACEDCAVGFCGEDTMCDASTNACVPVNTKPASFRSWIPSRILNVISFFGAFFQNV